MSGIAAVDFDVLVNATAIADAAVVGVVVERDLDQPTMCLVSLRNPVHEYDSKYALGTSVEIRVGGLTPATAVVGTKTTIFKGELVGIEPNHSPGGNQVSLRAFDRLHRLTRGRKSKTYQDQSDQDVAATIAQEYGLSLEAGSTPTIKHAHIYQHNQTDLEFLLARARTIGFQVWCEDSKLFFEAPRLDVYSGLEFVLSPQNVIAKSKLRELAMTYLAAEAEVPGDARLKPGIVVKIVVNPDDASDQFNGKYLVRGCTHRIDGEYTTTMRLRRDAERG